MSSRLSSARRLSSGGNNVSRLSFPGMSSVTASDAEQVFGYRFLNDQELVDLVTVDSSKRLGGGAGGQVYAATFEGLPAALKMMHPARSRKEDDVLEFLREAEQLSRLHHRCVFLWGATGGGCATTVSR